MEGWNLSLQKTYVCNIRLLLILPGDWQRTPRTNSLNIAFSSVSEASPKLRRDRNMTWCLSCSPSVQWKELSLFKRSLSALRCWCFLWQCNGQKSIFQAGRSAGKKTQKQPNKLEEWRVRRNWGVHRVHSVGDWKWWGRERQWRKTVSLLK